MADPVVVVAIATPVPGHGEAVRDALLAAVPPVHAEPGCERYALHARADGALVMLERWSSQEALDVHGAGENLRVLGAALDGHLAAPLDVTVLKPLLAGDPERGAL